MKKFAASCFLVLVSVITITCFSACNNGSELAYGEKYGKDNNCFVFNADGTGKNYYYKQSETSVTSYVINFLWQIQSDNYIYLVFDSVTYNDDHTGNKDVTSVVSRPISYSKDMITYTYVSGYMAAGTYTSQFIRQGSRLDLSD